MHGSFQLVDQFIPGPHILAGKDTESDYEEVCNNIIVQGLGSQRNSWLPSGLENGKAFSSQGILPRLEKSENFTQNTGKIRKNYIGKLKKNKYWKSQGSLSV